ncbi:flagellar export protein FliJ [Nitrospina gracilis]|uniref:flagellar export protein FliJ n=1 Tax=Nitrospina gracilis TaxID=35801 RepID=UPI001F013CB6|nr:flagellar export protein FliJ [Nitrospina gracilis]MCF8721527.1 flagellar export protein FliJ [Nitrospina gracilis Nb-211]
MSFRLEGLLRVRKNRENMVQRAFAEINAQLVAHRETLHRLNEQRRHQKEALNRKFSENLDASTLNLYDHFFEGDRLREQVHRKTIDEVSEKMETKRQELAETMKKRRTLEVLKEQHILREKKEAQKRETAFLDDVAASQWHRREP